MERLPKVQFTSDVWALEAYLSPDLHIVKITPEQYSVLMYELDKHPDLVLGIQATYKVKTLQDLPAELYQATLHKIIQIKKIKEQYDV